jgi:hypothetical protein
LQMSVAKWRPGFEGADCRKAKSEEYLFKAEDLDAAFQTLKTPRDMFNLQYGG